MAIRITARREGFYRAGISHPGVPTLYPDDAFTKEQIEQLEAEPMLIFERVGAGEDGGGEGSKKSQKKEKGASSDDDKGKQTNTTEKPEGKAKGK